MKPTAPQRRLNEEKADILDKLRRFAHKLDGLYSTGKIFARGEHGNMPRNNEELEKLRAGVTQLARDVSSIKDLLRGSATAHELEPLLKRALFTSHLFGHSSRWSPRDAITLDDLYTEVRAKAKSPF